MAAALRALGVVLYALRLHRVVIWLNRRHPKVLAFHAFDETETDFTRGLGINTPPARFAEQLDYLQRHYRVVPIDALAAGPWPERALAITIDDGYRSVYEHAFPLLRARGLPATVYLVADAIGNERLVWVNELNWLLHRHGAVARPIAARLLCDTADASPEAIVHRAVMLFDTVLIDRVLTAIRQATGVDPSALAREARLFVTWDEVSTMCAAGVSFGNHTVSHPNLARLMPADQYLEISRATAIIASHVRAAPALALPFGLGGPDVAAAAHDAGCTMVLGLGGTNRSPQDPTVARVPMATASLAVLFAELEVVTPCKDAVRRALRWAA
jgi:peptidoglycan/xylan/chitin deacetylase (PgdA/CDA1 family)